MKKLLFTLLLLVTSLTLFAQSDSLPTGATNPLSNVFKWQNPNDTTERKIFINWGKSGGVNRSDRMTRYSEYQKGLSSLLPVGLHGQIMKAIADNSNKYAAYDALGIGSYITTQTELDSAKTRFVSQGEIFSTWKRFAHGGNVADPFNNMHPSDTIPLIPNQTNSYNYNPGTNIINSVLNSSSVSGFVSEKKLTNYTHTATLTSFYSGPPNDRDHGYDNDRIGLVIAYVDDYNDMVPNNAYGLNPADFSWPINVTDLFIPNQHTLCVLRERENNSTSYRVVYDYGKLSQKTIVNGSSGPIYKTTNNWGGAEVDVQVVRRGDSIYVYTSNFSDAPGGKGPLAFPLSFSLQSDPVLEKFRGPASYGYVTQSQANSQFKNVSINAGYNEIYDLRNGDVWVANSSGVYTIAPGRNIFDETPPRSFLFNETTGRLLWLKDDHTYAQLNTVAGDSSLTDVYARKDSTPVVLSTIADLIAYNGSSNTAIVKEKGRGGTFDHVTTGLTEDGGIVFNAIGKGGGTWFRNGNKTIADAAWYGVSKDSLNSNGTNANKALNSPYVSILKIGTENNDVLIMETPIYGANLTNKTIWITGELKLKDAVSYPLTQTVASGGTTIYVDQANTRFKVGDMVITNATTNPIGGTEAGENWQVASSARVTEIFNNRLTVDSASLYGASIDSSAIITKTNSIFTFVNSTNIKVFGGKLNGNKANVAFLYPRTKMTESFFSNTGLNFIGCTDIQVSGIEIYNFRLHGMKFAKNCRDFAVMHSHIHDSDNKNIIVHFGGRDMTFEDLLLERSEYEDNLNINASMAGYSIANITVLNVTSKYAGRKGLRLQGSIVSGTASIVNYRSINDGQAIENDASDVYFKGLYVQGVKGYRYGAMTIDGAIAQYGSRTSYDGVTVDSVGAAPAMFYIGSGYNTFSNVTVKNMPLSLSTGKAVWKGGVATVNTRITSTNYMNVDSSKVYLNGSGSYFAPTAASTTFVQFDRPRFSTTSNSRIRFGDYSAGTYLTQSESNVFDINTTLVPTLGGSQNVYTNMNVFDGQSFLHVQRAAGNSTGYAWSRTSQSRRFDMYIDGTAESGSNAGSNFVFRANTDAGASLGNIFTVDRATQVVSFGKAPIVTELTANQAVFTDANKKLVTSGTLPLNRGGTGSTILAAGGLIFSTGSTLTNNNSQLVWDNINNRLGIGTNSPSAAFSVGATSQFQITSSGIVAAGIWNGGAIGMAYGGTGLTSVGANNVLGGNAAGTAIEAKSLSGTQGVSVTNGAGTVAIGLGNITPASVTSAGQVSSGAGIVAAGGALLGGNLTWQVSGSPYSIAFNPGISTYLTGNRVLNLPDKNGTLAVTSDIDTTVLATRAYGLANYFRKSASNTLTGQNTFTQNISMNNSVIEYVRGGFGLLLSWPVYTANRIINYPDKNGTFALQSDIPYFENYSASGNGSLTTISIAHGLSGISSTSKILVTAKNSASAGWSYVTTDATNVNITYSVAPPSGTNNLSFDIQIKP